jgi:hypothetical protein
MTNVERLKIAWWLADEGFMPVGPVRLRALLGEDTDPA